MDVQNLFLVIARGLELLSRLEPKLDDAQLEKGLRKMQLFWNQERPLVLHTLN